MLGNKKKTFMQDKVKKRRSSRALKSVFKPHLKNKRGIRKDTRSVEFFLLSILD